MLEPAILRPATEAVLQTAPPAALSAAAAARVHRNGPSRLVARMVAQNSSVSRSRSAGGMGATVAEVPALLARKSSRPSASIASRTIFSAVPGLETSPGAPITARPSARSRSTAAAPREQLDRGEPDAGGCTRHQRGLGSKIAHVRPSRKGSPGHARAKPWRQTAPTLSTHLAEENAALGLGSRLGFHDFHHHGLGRNGEILHHG